MPAAMKSFDEVVEKYFPSGFGLWQIALLCTAIPAVQPPFVLFGQLGFLAPKHRCRQPQLARLNWSFEAITNFSVPFKTDPMQPPRIGQSFEPCREFNLDALMTKITNRTTLEEALTLRNELGYNMTSRPCTHGVTFDMRTAPIEKGIAIYFDITCQRELFISSSNSAYFVGMLLGFSISGSIQDNFGRRVPLLVTIGLTIATVAATSALSPNIWVFIILRFITACFINVGFVIVCTLLSEVGSSRSRNAYTTSRKICSVLTRCYMIFATYCFQDWRWAYIVFAAPLLMIVPGFWLWIESPRWLISQGRVDEAEATMLLLLRRNGRMLDEAERADLHTEISDLAAVWKDGARRGQKGSMLREVKRVLLLVRVAKLRRRMLFCTLIFTLQSFGFYGVNFYAVRLQGNPFLIATIVGFMNIPGALLQYITFRFYDRKRPFVAYYSIISILLGLGSVLLAIQSSSWPVVAVNTIAVTLYVALFSMLYIRIPELFPSNLRGSAIGLAGAIGRFGSILAMYVERLDEMVWPPLPLILFGLGALCAAVIACFLPPGDGKMEDVYENSSSDSALCTENNPTQLLQPQPA